MVALFPSSQQKKEKAQWKTLVMNSAPPWFASPDSNFQWCFSLVVNTKWALISFQNAKILFEFWNFMKFPFFQHTVDNHHFIFNSRIFKGERKPARTKAENNGNVTKISVERWDDETKWNTSQNGINIYILLFTYDLNINLSKKGCIFRRKKILCYTIYELYQEVFSSFFCFISL